MSPQKIEVLHGDCIEVMKQFDDNTFDSVVTDPPYGIALLGNEWDTMEPAAYQYWTEEWGREALRVCKPGAFIVGFSATRTFHRMVVGLEDAGWEVRDAGVWLYRSGQPKGGYTDLLVDAYLGAERPTVGLARGVDYRRSRLGFSRMAGEGGRSHAKDYELTAPGSEEAERWVGYSHALKPCIEPWTLCRKPLEGTIAENVLKWNTGVMNIGATRITVNAGEDRWTPNAITMEDDEHLEVFRISGSQVADFRKAGQAERPSVDGVEHPSVKPLELMKYLVRLVTPEGGTVLEPFAGTGSTLVAADVQGFSAVGIEAEEKYIPLIESKLSQPAQHTMF